MYLEHFGLKEEPFAVTSDPRYLYLSQSHEEAISHLMYCVQYRKGFAAITGEVGTGKTTLLNAFLTRLGEQHSVAFVYQSASTTLELLGYIFKDIGLPLPAGGKAEWLAAFNEFLLSEHAQQRECVLVVDEAQNLSVEVLEDLRLISNFETPTQKLVQIILAGQNELATMLRRPELRQLNQRIFIQYQMRPLSAEETGRYVQHRLSVAGAKRVDIFKAAALAMVHRYSGGIPRLVNQICDITLLRAAHQRDQVIGASLVRKVQQEDLHHRGGQFLKGLEAQSPTRVGKLNWRGIMLPVAFLALGAAAGMGIRHWQEEPVKTRMVEQASSPAVVARPVRVAEPAGQVAESVAVGTKPVASRQAEDATGNVEPAIESPRPSGHLKAKGRGEYTVRGVEVGDRLSSLVRETYGFSTWELMAEVLKANPAVSNPNHIIAGANIVLPALEDSTLNRVRRGKNL